MRVSFIEKTLFTIHLGVAAMSKCPELALEKDDAKTLGEAVAGVLALYKVRMTPKQEAYGLLMEAVAQVYPPMIFSVWMRKRMEAEQRAKTAPKAQPFKPPPPQPPADNRAPAAPDPQATAGMPEGFDPANITIPK